MFSIKTMPFFFCRKDAKSFYSTNAHLVFKAKNIRTLHFMCTTVKTLNIGTPRPATVVVLNIKQFNFTRK